MKSYRFILIIFCALNGLVHKIYATQKRQIITDDFTLEFYIDAEKKNKKSAVNKTYTWYKSGEIYRTQGDVGGYLLHGNFIKRYKDNQLAEKGNFNNGLKEGIWKTWYPNGNLQMLTTWKKGIKKGAYTAYNEFGKAQVLGSYKANKKVGKWIYIAEKDTTYFRKGVLNKKKIERLENKSKLKSERKKLSRKERIKAFFDHLFKKKNAPSKKKKVRKKAVNKKALKKKTTAISKQKKTSPKKSISSKSQKLKKFKK